jgi:hypothetical protein
VLSVSIAPTSSLGPPSSLEVSATVASVGLDSLDPESVLVVGTDVVSVVDGSSVALAPSADENGSSDRSCPHARSKSNPIEVEARYMVEVCTLCGRRAR